MEIDMMRRENPEDNKYVIQRSHLEKKFSQILGFTIPSHLLDDEDPLKSIQDLIPAENKELLEQLKTALHQSKSVDDYKTYTDFFRKDISEMGSYKGYKTIYSVDEDQEHMSQVERIFRYRDKQLELNGGLPYILPEEEHKKHQREGILPNNMIQQNAIYNHVPQPQPKYDKKEDKNVVPQYALDVQMEVQAPEAMNTGLSTTKQQRSTTSGQDKTGSARKVVHKNDKNPNESIKFSTIGDQEDTYCVCKRKNDNQMYMQCEGKCEWYHPKCVGFDKDFIKQHSNNYKFLCPMCDPQFKHKYEVEKRNYYTKISSKEKKMFFIYIPSRNINETAANQKQH